MAVSYKKLWKLLIDKSKGESVTTDTLVKICKALDCNLDGIMELVDECEK